MVEFEKAYEQAREDGILPGYALMAGNVNEVLFSTGKGVQSLKAESNRPFQTDTICAIASMTKLMTAIAALQCVEAGLLDLDKSVSEVLPTVGKYGVINAFDDEKNEAVTQPTATPITLRMLLSHTSGHEYDWFSPLLGKWRASRGEELWRGSIVNKSTLPLVFEPGTGFAYGAGSDWAGRMVEIVTQKSLEEYMSEKIWSALDIEDITFWPRKQPHMEGRLAGINTLSPEGEGPAVDIDFDMTFGTDECVGGGGAYASAEAYLRILQAVLRHDETILKEESWEELLRPQLTEQTKKAFNDYINSSPMHLAYLGMCLPPSLPKTFSFAGMIALEGQEGRMNNGTMYWGGVPSEAWYIDFEAGICGVATCQILPPMSPKIMQLHEQFQRSMFEKFGKR